MHPLHDYLCQQLDDMLQKRGVVVFYDPRREFEAFFDRELKEAGTGYDGLWTATRNRLNLAKSACGRRNCSPGGGSEFFGRRKRKEP